MRRRATIPMARTLPHQHLGVLIRIDEQRRRGDSVQHQVAAVSLRKSTAVSRTWLPYSTTRDWRGLPPVVQHPNSNPRWAPGGRHGWEVTPEAFTHFCVFTITLLVASRQLLSSATGEQVVGDTMANASLLGLVIWSVIMINLNTWNKSIRVFESLFNQHCKSRQSTNLNTGILSSRTLRDSSWCRWTCSRKFIVCTFRPSFW